MGKGLSNGKEQIGETGMDGVAKGKECGDETGKKDLANGKGHGSEKGNAGALDKQSNVELRPGDMTWIKLRGASWWPAQIVDENAVSDDAKPRRKGKSSEVLVRLYGTYTYSYMDPVTSVLEFRNVLKRKKGGQREIFLKALEQDLSKLHSGKDNAGTPGKAHAKGNKTPSKRVAEGLDDDTCQTPEGIARRLKVMQDLGLTAPSGSPFVKNEQELSVV